MAISEGVVDHLSVAPTVDDVMIAQDSQLMRDGCPVETSRGRQIADAQLTRQERGQETEASGIPQHAEEGGHGFDTGRRGQTSTGGMNRVRMEAGND